MIAIGCTVFSVGSYGVFREHKKIIVFDIDHTLIHSMKITRANEMNLSIYKKPDFNMYDESDNPKRYVWVRPFYKFVIPILSNFTTLHIFTRATKDYSDEILANIDKDQKYFSERLYRESSDHNSGKNLDLITGNYKDKTLFYHIPQYEVNNCCDIELLKFLFRWAFVL